MLRAFLCCTVTGFVLGASLAGSESATVGTTPQEQALLAELQHLTSTLAPQLWTDWPRQFPPVLLRTRGHEILIGHPHPPAGFASVPGERDIWVRVAGNTSDVQAAYPLGGLLTVVMSAPGEDADPALWVLRAAHEAFHCYHGSNRIRDPFVGRFASHSDVSFPYPYDDPNDDAALRLEAEAMINPIRFVGEGVRGREMFYFLGMGNAYALDRLTPNWRTAYRTGTVDELLELGMAQDVR